MHAERPRHSGVVRILQLGADHFAVGDRLVVHLDLPSAVVGDDDQDRRLVANGGVDLDGVEAECAVAGRHHDGLVGKARLAAMP